MKFHEIHKHRWAVVKFSMRRTVLSVTALAHSYRKEIFAGLRR